MCYVLTISLADFENSRKLHYNKQGHVTFPFPLYRVKKRYCKLKNKKRKIKKKFKTKKRNGSFTFPDTRQNNIKELYLYNLFSCIPILMLIS